ncbi:MAG: protein-L-isoaspartate(D-aspartate) O-methyltransferase [Deltaproteobacteria bacterium]|nr:protein-L-isoaspartate(D-aspartate) O-methyltransferase [Deltaproteobacteria bacterium]
MNWPGHKDDWLRPRRRMIEEHLKGRDVTDPQVLFVMENVPRHLFVDQALAPEAYADRPLPIGYGQTISQPYMVACMTQALALSPSDRVLEIGAGCGYQTAVLSALAGEVCAIERLAPLHAECLRNLAQLGVANAQVKLGDGRLGWPEKAPFQAVLAAAYDDKVPPPLVEQLAPGGRLVMPVGVAEGQQLLLLTKDQRGRVAKRVLTSCRFVPLI